MKQYILLLLSVIFCLGCISATHSDHSDGIEWKFEETTGNKPDVRAAATLVTIGNKAHMFGGFLECFDVNTCDHHYYESVHTINLDTNKWKEEPLRTVRPGARILHGAVKYDQNMIIVKGAKYNIDISNIAFYDDMWSYNPQTNVWTEIVSANAGPGARFGPGVVISESNNKLYLFGGLSPSFEIQNDMWSFNFATRVWTLLIAGSTTSTSIPAPRFTPVFQIDNDRDLIFIFGGDSVDDGTVNAQANDTWVYQRIQGNIV